MKTQLQLCARILAIITVKSKYKMKTLFFTSILSSLFFSCAKKDKVTEPPSINYSQYKIKTATTTTTNFSGSSSNTTTTTNTYYYNGSEIKQESRTSSGINLIYAYSLANNIYTTDLYNNGTLSASKTFYKLSESGYVDSTWITINGNLLQWSKYDYNANGNATREFHQFGNYQLEKKYRYVNEKPAYINSYRYSQSPSIPILKDSCIIDYYPDLLYRAPYFTRGLPGSFFGKPAKNLMKKITYYDQLNNNKIRQTHEYSYQTNEMGLVTKSTLNIYTQPENVRIYSDTSYYNYYNM